MKIKCKKCKHEWEYKGESKYYVTCPRCHKNINIENKRKLADKFTKWTVTKQKRR